MAGRGREWAGGGTWGSEDCDSEAPPGLLKSSRRSAVRPRGLPLVGEARAASSAGETARKTKQNKKKLQWPNFADSPKKKRLIVQLDQIDFEWSTVREWVSGRQQMWRARVQPDMIWFKGTIYIDSVCRVDNLWKMSNLERLQGTIANFLTRIKFYLVNSLESRYFLKNRFSSYNWWPTTIVQPNMIKLKIT